MKTHLSLLLVLFCSLLDLHSQNDTLDVYYSEEDAAVHNLRLFSSEDVLDLSLRFDITTFRRLRSDTVELDAVLTIHLGSTDSINKNIKLRARGIMRRSYCDIPPIRLNFKKSDSQGDEFSDVDKIKLVTHCKVGNEEYLLREFLAYKLYNVLTDYSFKVRLARIKYINTGKKGKPLTEYAFLIEPDDALCKRLNITEIEDIRINQRMVRPEMMNRMAIFNFMIGNPDWSVPARHNVVFLKDNVVSQSGAAIVIPYDFDYSGMVNANYAIPTEGLGIESVTERVYLGMCRSSEEFTQALQEFSEKKDEFHRVINEFPYLKEKSRAWVVNYLNGFLLELDKKGSVLNKLERDCIKL